MRPFDADIFDRFLRIASRLKRSPGESKHRAGRQSPRNHRLLLQRHRKAQRQARRYQRLCAAGRKHRYRGHP